MLFSCHLRSSHAISWASPHGSNADGMIYASSDALLMPSAFEPCGLAQLIAFRYGTVPIVHEIGGLKDTVKPYNQFEQTGTGFSFRGY